MLTWYINRLRAMSLPEIVHRVNERIKKATARGRLEGWDRYQFAGPPPRLPGLLENLLSAPDEIRAEIANASDFVLSGQFEALGVTWPRRNESDLFPAEVWRLDPVTGRFWPGADRYCFDISYRHERNFGDIKYVWEFNRLQFLQPLAADAALTGNTSAVKAIESAVHSWYASNPPFRGVAWNSGIELSLRAISLLIVTTLCGNLLSTDTVNKIRAILHAHLATMVRYPSRFSSANNHLIAEIAGEFLISLSMKELPQAAQLDLKCRKLLALEAEKQIFPDGVGAEQSPTYGAFTAEFIILCSIVARADGKPLAGQIEARLKDFASYIAWLSDIDGKVPGICDDDEGQVITLSRYEPAYAASVCAGVAGYLGIPPIGPRPREFSLRDVLFRAPLTGSPPPLGLRTFPDGGYTIVREKKLEQDLHIIFDHAPLGYLSIAAHGHADALSVIFSVDGKPVFVDPGTYLYHSGGVWRDWFRGTRAHNTLNIEGVDQSTMSGPFNWSHKASAKLETIVDSVDWSVTASHNGYEKRYGVLHQRTIESSKTGFVITDNLLHTPHSVAVNQEAEIVYQLAPDCDAYADGMNVTVSRGNTFVAKISFSCKGNISLKAGGNVGEGGWYSPAFGKKTQATRVSWRGVIPEEGIVSDISICLSSTFASQL